MNLPADMSMLLRGTPANLREVKLVLDQQGIRNLTGPVPGDATGTKAWLAVARHDEARAMAAYEAHLKREVARSGLPVHDHVADFDADETQCPACQTPFKTKGATRCPECGLNFGG